MPIEPADHDVIVVGSGAAGMMAAVTAATELSVGLLTDRGLGTSNSAVAQGGLQLPDPDPMSVERFRADMLASGGDDVDHRRLDHFVATVRDVVLLLAQWGLSLDLDDAGQVLKISAGGLSEPRIVTSGDRIGSAILKVLRRRIGELNVDVRTRTSVTGLVMDDEHQRIRVDCGSQTFTARSVVVATGGRSFQHAADLDIETSNPVNDNARMHDILRELGVAERDTESFQLHPYGIVGPGGTATGKCVPESLGAMGAYVADRVGTRLAPPGANRSQLTDAMHRCLAERRGVVLGTTHACRLVLDDVDMDSVCAKYSHLRRHLDGNLLDGGDVAVRPVVHYQLGGFCVEPNGATTIPNLFLAGEITGGLHGTNRLMGNGITEAVVDGWTAGNSVISGLRTMTPLPEH